jgi:hypothetical protein
MHLDCCHGLERTFYRDPIVLRVTITDVYFPLLCLIARQSEWHQNSVVPLFWKGKEKGCVPAGIIYTTLMFILMPVLASLCSLPYSPVPRTYQWVPKPTLRQIFLELQVFAIHIVLRRNSLLCNYTADYKQNQYLTWGMRRTKNKTSSQNSEMRGFAGDRSKACTPSRCRQFHACLRLEAAP